LVRVMGSCPRAALRLPSAPQTKTCLRGPRPWAILGAPYWSKSERSGLVAESPIRGTRAQTDSRNE
jgi:hypothetical protein